MRRFMAGLAIGTIAALSVAEAGDPSIVRMAIDEAWNTIERVVSNHPEENVRQAWIVVKQSAGRRSDLDDDDEPVKRVSTQ